MDPSSSPAPPTSSTPTPAPPSVITSHARPIQLLYYNEQGKLSMDDKAVDMLQHLKEPIAVVSACGRALEGKSFILNQGAYQIQILSVAALLSTVFIYNQMGDIDETALNHLSQVLQTSEFQQVSPILVWLLRDFYLDLVKDNQKITPLQYLELALCPLLGSGQDIDDINQIRAQISEKFPARECFTLVRPINCENTLQQMNQTSLDGILRAEFLSGLGKVREFVFEKTVPKIFGTTVMTGPVLVSIMKYLLGALNNDAVPTMSSLLQSLEEVRSHQAFDSATKSYVSLCKTAQEEARAQDVQQALAEFNASTVGAGLEKKRLKKKLRGFFKKADEDYESGSSILESRKASKLTKLDVSNALREAGEAMSLAANSFHVISQDARKVADLLSASSRIVNNVADLAVEKQSAQEPAVAIADDDVFYL